MTPFERSGTTLPVMQCHIPEDQNPQIGISLAHDICNYYCVLQLAGSTMAVTDPIKISKVWR